MPGYGYRENGRAASSGSGSRGGHRKRSRADKGAGGSKRDKKDKKQRKRARGDADDGGDHRGDRGDRGDRDRAGADRSSGNKASSNHQADIINLDAEDPAAVAPAPPPSQEPSSRRVNWRDEHKKDAEEDDDAGTDGMVLQQETDEDVDRKLAESRARREALIAKWVNRGEAEGSTFQLPDTNTSMHDDVESDGEVAAFFAEKQKELEGKEPEAEDENAIEERKAINRFILEARAVHDGDMFTENDDAKDALNKAGGQAVDIATTGASADDWNDVEGYYKAKIGEVMAERYSVTEDTCGKGTFSNVVKAKDLQDGGMVAIKVMRCNDMMRKAAEKEIEFLERLAGADRGNKRNVIRLLRHFMYRDHLCLVFECMWDNLRVALKKYTKDRGMSLKAVRAYTRQLLVAMQHIHRCGLIHADIKPDNILITAGHNLVKICDLGSAMELTEVEPTPYLVSRFYRAPEICLGAKYGPPSDIWALGTSLCELFTGKILFPGKTNNDMLRLFMEIKGKLPGKLIKSGMNWKQHFDDRLDFKFVNYDKVTRKRRTQIISDCSAKRSLSDIVLQRVGDKQKSEDREDQAYVRKAKEFADLMSQMTSYDPEKRATTEDLLQHPFVASGFGGPGSKPLKPDGKK